MNTQQHHHHHQHQNRPEQAEPVDVVAVPVSLEDAYRGAVKNVMLTEPRACPQCRGSGAKDPEADVKACGPCGGSGASTGRIGPFVVSTGECGACRGRGVSPPAPGRECGTCTGSGVTVQPVPMTLDIPRGVRDGHSTKFPGNGSFDPKRRRHNDVELRIALQMQPQQQPQQQQSSDRTSMLRIDAIDADTGRVTATLRMSLADMLNGFDLGPYSSGGSAFSPWGKPMRIRSPGYIRPDRTYVTPGLGFPIQGGDGSSYGDLSIKLEIHYPDELNLLREEKVSANDLSVQYI
jgi:DnaJ-class molecular chaperone